MGSLVWVFFVVPAVAAGATVQGPNDVPFSMNGQPLSKAISTQSTGAGGIFSVLEPDTSKDLGQQRASLLGRHQDDHGRSGRPSLIYLDTLVIGVLVLVVVGLVTVRFLAGWWKGKTEGHNDLDRLTEEEWEGRP